ncbi:hypothetical protein BDV11DRAFT_176189, partial [Aspergillus similis]
MPRKNTELSLSSLIPHFNGNSVILVCLVCAFAPGVRAGWWDDFSNNFASDVAPFITLLGEKATTQFLSESLNIWDNFVFAVAPLGVLTAMVSAIRVCGSPSLRAFIGRAAEGAGDAEIELLSCTSRTTTELHSDGGISRIFGDADILEILFVDESEMHKFLGRKDIDAAIIAVLREQLEREIEPNKTSQWAPVLRIDGSQRPKESIRTVVEGIIRSGTGAVNGFPRLARSMVSFCRRNKGRMRQNELASIADWGIVAALKQRVKSGDDPEVVWKNNRQNIMAEIQSKVRTKRCLFTLDEAAEFGIVEVEKHRGELANSRRALEDGQYVHKPNLSLNVGIKQRGPVYTYAAAVSGLTLQIGTMVYAGLTTVYQNRFSRPDKLFPQAALPLFVIGTTLLCMGMFGCAYIIEKTTKETYYRQKTNACCVWWLQPGEQQVGDQTFSSWATSKNSIRRGGRIYVRSVKDSKQSSSKWLFTASLGASGGGFVFQLLGYRGLHSSVLFMQLLSTLVMATVRAFLRTKRSSQKEDMIRSERDTERPLPGHELDWLAHKLTRSVHAGGPLEQMNEGRTLSDLRLTEEVFRVRVRLAELTLSWKVSEVRSHAKKLKATVEQTMELLSPILRKESQAKTSERLAQMDIPSLQFGVPCYNTTQASGKLEITIHGVPGAKRWNIAATELEAAIGLWSRALQQNAEVKLRRIIAGGKGRDQQIADYNLWVYRKSKNEDYTPQSDELLLGSDGVFGHIILPGAGYQTETLSCVEMDASSIISLVTQDLYMAFLSCALGKVSSFKGKVSWEQESYIAPLLVHDRIELLATIFEDNIGSREEGYMCIVPLLRKHNLLPTINPMSRLVRERVRTFQQRGLWDEAKKFLELLQENSIGCYKDYATAMLGILYLFAMRKEDSEPVFKFGVDGIAALLKDRLLGDNTHNTRFPDGSLIDQIGYVASRRVSSVRNMEWRVRWHSQLKAAGVPYPGSERSHTAPSDILSSATPSPGAPLSEGPSSEAAFHAPTGDVIWDIFYERRENSAIDSGQIIGAAQKGDVLLAGLILCRAEADLDADKIAVQHDVRCNCTPLHYAAKIGSEDLTEMFLDVESLAAINTVDQELRTPLITACQTVAKGATDVAIRLLEMDEVDIHKIDSEEAGGIHYAAATGKYTVVQRLIEKGADVFAANKYGETAFLCAAKQGQEGVLKILLGGEGDQKAHRPDKQGRTPLAWAARHGHEKVVSLLIENKAPLNQLDNDGRTPVSWAADNDRADVVRMMAKKEADLDKVDKGGWTPVARAAEKGYKQAVRVLAENGADLNRPENGGRAPLAWAAGNGYEEVVRLLAEKGADLDQLDNNGRSPVSWAAEHGRKEV